MTRRMSNCQTCAHGYDLNPLADAIVFCPPQKKHHDPSYCCTGYRRITLAEIDERTCAKFGAETGEIETQREIAGHTACSKMGNINICVQKVREIVEEKQIEFITASRTRKRGTQNAN